MKFFYDNGWVDYHCDDEPRPAPYEYRDGWVEFECADVSYAFRWIRQGTFTPHYAQPYAAEMRYDAYGIDGLEFA